MNYRQEIINVTVYRVYRCIVALGLSGFVWFVADWFGGYPRIHITHAIWNAIMRLMYYLTLDPLN